MNTKKLFLTILFAIFAVTLCFLGCKKENEGDNEIQKVLANPIVWNGQIDKDLAMPIGYTPSQKQNASGPKIPSNSHSTEFPGIYFIWDSKHNDNGYMKVHRSVFEAYASFVITTKEGGNYFDFRIEIQPGQEMTDDDCYVFFIAKVQGNKNINMVFVSEMIPQPDSETPVKYYYIFSGYELGFKEQDYFVMNWEDFLNSKIDRTPFDDLASNTFEDKIPNPRSTFDEYAKWVWLDLPTEYLQYADGNTLFDYDLFIEDKSTLQYGELIFVANSAAAFFINDQFVAVTGAVYDPDIFQSPQSAAELMSASGNSFEISTINLAQHFGKLKNGHNIFTVVGCAGNSENPGILLSAVIY